jgi:hypothetical protein
MFLVAKWRALRRKRDQPGDNFENFRRVPTARPSEIRLAEEWEGSARLGSRAGQNLCTVINMDT